MNPMKTINSWQNEIHHNSVEKGWYDKGYVPVPQLIAMIHSEISELWMAYQNKDILNFREEFADIAIRLMDGAEYLGIDLEQCSGVRVFSQLVEVDFGYPTIPTIVGDLHAKASRMLEAYRGSVLEPKDNPEFKDALGRFFRYLVTAAHHTRTNLDKEVAVKHDVNLSRPYRHGNKRC